MEVFFVPFADMDNYNYLYDVIRFSCETFPKCDRVSVKSGVCMTKSGNGRTNGCPQGATSRVAPCGHPFVLPLEYRRLHVIAK